MKVTLIVVEGAKPARVPLQLPTTIGRSERAKIKLRASLVSRTHCELYEDAEQLLIRDLGSSNGTKVNGERIFEPTRLGTDDMIQIGPVTLRVLCDHKSAIHDLEPQDSNVKEHKTAADENVVSSDQDAPREAGTDADDNKPGEPKPDEHMPQERKAGERKADENMPDVHVPDERPADEDLIAASVVDEAGSSEPPVVVSYEEKDEGSVIHIEEAAEFLDELNRRQPSPKAGDSVLQDLHDVKPDRVDTDDSALDDFFKKLE